MKLKEAGHNFCTHHIHEGKSYVVTPLRSWIFELVAKDPVNREMQNKLRKYPS